MSGNRKPSSFWLIGDWQVPFDVGEMASCMLSFSKGDNLGNLEEIGHRNSAESDWHYKITDADFQNEL